MRVVAVRLGVSDAVGAHHFAELDPHGARQLPVALRGVPKHCVHCRDCAARALRGMGRFLVRFLAHVEAADVLWCLRRGSCVVLACVVNACASLFFSCSCTTHTARWVLPWRRVFLRLEAQHHKVGAKSYGASALRFDFCIVALMGIMIVLSRILEVSVVRVCAPVVL